MISVGAFVYFPRVFNRSDEFGAYAVMSYKLGDEIRLRVHDLNHDGDGVARAEDGRVFFVPGALIGDQVRARVASLKKRYAIAEMIELEAPASGRIEPPCPVAKTCGGCAVQAWDYSEQLAWKERRVKEALARIGGLDAPLFPIIGMAEPFRYRAKAQYPVRQSPSGEVLAGFYRRGSHEVVPSEDCIVQHPLIPPAVAAARRLIEELGLSVYDERTRKGFVRHIVARVSFSNNELMLILVTADRDFPEKQAWIEGLREALPNLVSAVQNVNPNATNVVMGPESIVLWGRPSIVETFEDVSFEISPNSFFQVNPKQALELYRVVRQFAALSGRERIWDVYCGTGSIGLFLAPQAALLRGVDVVPEAINDARRNARRNGVENRAKFETGRAEDVLPRWVSEGGRADVCLLDPPRKGSDPVTLESICQARPRRIVYVSCNPSTLARDLAFVVERGYRVLGIQPVDMFPHTPHVEAVAHLIA